MGRWKKGDEMKEDMKKMNCGACGHEKVKIYTDGEMIVMECCDCKATTDVTISKPKIHFSFGENSEGMMCIF